MKSFRLLIIAAAIAMPALTAIAQTPVQYLAVGSCPVNLQLMPIATIVAPSAINVQIATIDTAERGSSSGNDYGTFLIGTNLGLVQLTATIGSPGLTGGTWLCRLQGISTWDTVSTNTYPGPIPAGTPFNVFVMVQNVNMTAVVYNPAFVYDTTLTLTMSVP